MIVENTHTYIINGLKYQLTYNQIEDFFGNVKWYMIHFHAKDVINNLTTVEYK